MAGHLDPSKLHVAFSPGTDPGGPVVPRAYTLTHSDFTGELFLTVGVKHDRGQISGWYTRLMRDEVLAEWGEAFGPGQDLKLEVHCHVSGGVRVGTAGFRYGIFRRHMPMVLEAFRYGDRRLVEDHPEVDQAQVWVLFHSTKTRYNFAETWGRFGDHATAAR